LCTCKMISPLITLITFSDKEPSVRRALLQNVPSSETDMDATTVTEDLAMETETPETGSTTAEANSTEVTASS